MVNKKKVERRIRNKRDKEWREAIKSRDKVCQICDRTVFLNAHHIIPREDRDFRWDLDNGILLCSLHHRFSRVNSPHKNPFIFQIWLEKYKSEQFDRLIQKVSNK